MVRSINIYNNFNIKSTHQKSIILIGNFDGLHLGHQKLFSLAKKYKKKYSSKIGVLTFEPMPKMYFNKDIKNFRIANQKQKIDLLKKQSVDFIIVKKFNREFSNTKSIDFIKNILSKKLKAKFIFVSHNFRFGNKREGTVKQLVDNQKQYNFKIIKPMPLLNKKKIVSSTIIRNYLQRGKLKEVNKFLNRNWSIQGKVQKGRKLQKSFKYIKGIANIGFRPTFSGKKILLEVHLFNFNRNLYNKNLTVEFLKFIRKEKKFKDIKQLKKQISKDIKVAKK